MSTEQAEETGADDIDRGHPGCMEILVCILLPLVGVIWGGALIAGRDPSGRGRRMIILSAIVLLVPLLLFLAALLFPIFARAFEAASNGR